MTRTHITYETAKRLKEFCPELPEPMGQSKSFNTKGEKTYPVYFRYRIEDVLSKKFCEALAGKTMGAFGPQWAAAELGYAYYHGGLPAVEAELMKMMEGK